MAGRLSRHTLAVLNAMAEPSAMWFWLAAASAGLFSISFVGAFAMFVLLTFVPPALTIGAGIAQVAAGTMALYLLFNAFRLLTKRRHGYHEDEPAPARSRGLNQALLPGISFALAALIVAYCSWWNYRLSSREYAHAKGCYAQMQTAYGLADFRARVTPGYARLEEGAARYLRVAEEHGVKLGMRREAVDQDLRKAAVAYSASYVRVPPAAAERNRPLFMDDVFRCLNDDWAPHGELFNP